MGNEFSVIMEFTYESVTRELKQQLNNTSQGIVYIGWLLRKAKESEIYREMYSTMTEYGQTEFGLSQSDVSRFIAINQKYSEGGNSPKLADAFSGFGSSKLVEMLTLQDDDVKIIDQGTTVAQIRELKHFEKSGADENAHAEPVEQQFVIAFFTPSAKHSHEMCQQQYSKCIQVLQGLQDPEYKERKIQEIINPSRNSVFTGKTVFAFLKDHGIKIKRLGGNSYVDISYLQVANILCLLFPDGLPEPEQEQQNKHNQYPEVKNRTHRQEKEMGSVHEAQTENDVDKLTKKVEEKQSNPQKSSKKKKYAMSHNADPVEPTAGESGSAVQEERDLKVEETEVIKAEDVEVIDPPEWKMQKNRIDQLRKKQKEALSHIEDMKKFARKADLIGIRSEIQMMQIILFDWERIQNEDTE